MSSNLDHLIFENKFMNVYTEKFKQLQEKNLDNILCKIIDLMNTERKNIQMVSDFLKFINLKISTLSTDQFDLIGLKYFNTLSDFYKMFMNIKVKEGATIELIKLLNMCFTNFFKIFHKLVQNYNDKHKMIINQIPISLKLYFKFYEEWIKSESNFEIIFSLNNTFSLTIICLINYFPSLMRTYEKKLEEIFKNLFSKAILSNLSFYNSITKENKQFLKYICISYCMLNRLNNDKVMGDKNLKINNFLGKLIENLNYHLKLITPKTLKSLKSEGQVKTELSKESDLIFSNSEIKINYKDLKTSLNLLYVLFKLFKIQLKSLPKNSFIEINLETTFLHIFNNLNHDQQKFSNSDYIVEGLSIPYFEIFKEIHQLKLIKLLSFLIKNFHQYLIHWNPHISKFLNRSLTKEDEFFKNFEKIRAFQNLFLLLITNLDCTLKLSIEEVIFKHCCSWLLDFFISYLERNDKTIVKVDSNYFKLAQMKTDNIKNKKGKINLLQMARQENQNEKFDKFSNNEMTEIISSYFNSKIKILTKF
jgi:hypothetical protein